jgi:hypothetical protein
VYVTSQWTIVVLGVEHGAGVTDELGANVQLMVPVGTDVPVTFSISTEHVVVALAATLLGKQPRILVTVLSLTEILWAPCKRFDALWYGSLASGV